MPGLELPASPPDEPSNFPSHLGLQTLLAGTELALHSKKATDQKTSSGMTIEDPGKVISKIMDWLPDGEMRNPKTLTREDILNDPFVKYAASETGEDMSSLGNAEKISKETLDNETGWKIDMHSKQTSDSGDAIKLKNILPHLDLCLGTDASVVIENPAKNNGKIELDHMSGVTVRGAGDTVIKPEEIRVTRENGESVIHVGKGHLNFNGIDATLSEMTAKSDGQGGVKGTIHATTDKDHGHIDTGFKVDKDGKLTLTKIES